MRGASARWHAWSVSTCALVRPVAPRQRLSRQSGLRHHAHQRESSHLIQAYQSLRLTAAGLRLAGQLSKSSSCRALANCAVERELSHNGRPSQSPLMACGLDRELLQVVTQERLRFSLGK
eukprot:6195543-Pleurochrysis_carterae.AAC.1